MLQLMQKQCLDVLSLSRFATGGAAWQRNPFEMEIHKADICLTYYNTGNCAKIYPQQVAIERDYMTSRKRQVIV